ncbi:MAG: tRNA dihydrouridine synthase [Promethearchaeota archaeon]
MSIIKKMKLGRIALDSNLILAPMQNVSSAPYRRFCRKVSDNIGLVFVPMLYTKRLEKNPSSVDLELYRIKEERPIAVQLIGSSIEALKKAIEFLECYEFDLLDLNAGCPSKRAIKANEGGYLMNDLKTLRQLIQTALKFSSRPVSLKIRTGFERPVETNEFISIIDNLGLEFITIHGRTVKDRFNDTKIDLDTIREIKKKLSIPVIGNGDLIDHDSAKNFLDYTNVDGLMIGRGSIGNPEIFDQIDKFLKNNIEISIEKDIIKWKGQIRLYEECIDEILDKNNPIKYQRERFKFTELYRNSIWLTKNINDSTRIRRKISKAKNLGQLKCIFNEVIQFYNS